MDRDLAKLRRQAVARPEDIGLRKQALSQVIRAQGDISIALSHRIWWRSLDDDLKVLLCREVADQFDDLEFCGLRHWVSHLAFRGSDARLSGGKQGLFRISNTDGADVELSLVPGVLGRLFDCADSPWFMRPALVMRHPFADANGFPTIVTRQRCDLLAAGLNLDLMPVWLWRYCCAPSQALPDPMRHSFYDAIWCSNNRTLKMCTSCNHVGAHREEPPYDCTRCECEFYVEDDDDPVPSYGEHYQRRRTRVHEQARAWNAVGLVDCFGNAAEWCMEDENTMSSYGGYCYLDAEDQVRLWRTKNDSQSLSAVRLWRDPITGAADCVINPFRSITQIPDRFWKETPEFTIDPVALEV